MAIDRITPQSQGASPLFKKGATAASEQEQISKQQAELQKRLNETQSYYKGMENDLQDEYVGSRENHESRMAKEREKQEAEYQALSQRGYERIVELKRRQDAEIQNLATNADRMKLQLQNQSEQEIAFVKEQNTKALQKEFGDTRLAINNEKMNREFQLADSKLQRDVQVKIAKDENQGQVTTLKAENAAMIENMRKGHEKAMLDAFAKYQNQMGTNQKQQQETLVKVLGDAARKVDKVRDDTSVKLSAYESRQSDPFYQFVNIDARLDKAKDEFVLRMKVPSHEEPGVSISVNDNSIIVSGTRQNTEKMALPQGGARSSSSFQSYTQTIPIDWPLNPSFMTRDYDGDTLVVRIPKRMSGPTPKLKSTPDLEDKLAVKKPDFPKALPIMTAQNQTIKPLG